jgi:hypothetical protein
MCRALIDKYVQVDAIVCPLDHTDHEVEVVAAFLVDVDGSVTPVLNNAQLYITGGGK